MPVVCRPRRFSWYTWIYACFLPKLSGVSATGKLIQHGVNSKPEGKVWPVFLARDGSLGGFKSVLSQHLDGFINEGCVQLGPEWDSGLGCNFAVRRLNVWTAAEIEGGVKLSGPGFAVAANNEFPSFGGNAGILSYAAGYNGYGALCRPGNVYELEGVWRDSPVIDVAFSDAALESIFGAEEVTLKTASGFLCSSVRGTTLHRSTWTSSYGATKRMRSFALQQSAKFGDTFHLQHCTWSPHCCVFF